MSEIPYTAKPHRIHRIIFILLAVSLPIMFIVFDNGEFWNSEEIFFRNLLLGFYGLFILFTIGMFVRKVEFTNDTIFHRSFFGITKIKKYKDIVDVTGEAENISIRFSDNSLIKVWTSEGNIHRILRIIKKKRDDNKFK
jgi:hypothetical protein